MCVRAVSLSKTASLRAVLPTISAFVADNCRWGRSGRCPSPRTSWGISMKLMRLVAAAVGVSSLSLSVAAADPGTDGKSAFMRVHGQALPPFGFVHFCQRFGIECAAKDNVNFSRFDAYPARLSELDAVNREINRRIAPVTDLELYGTEEYWTFPTNRGDCEDYVVLKRRELMQRGWPASALLITVVRDEVGDGHAVLTVRTRQGDYVLDNKVDEVRVWRDTPYKYLMRQSYLDPKLWMALDPRINRRSGNVAGVN